MPVAWFAFQLVPLLALPLCLINSLRAYFLPCLSPFLALTYNYTQTLTQTLYHALSYTIRRTAAQTKKAMLSLCLTSLLLFYNSLSSSGNQNRKSLRTSLIQSSEYQP